MSRRFATPGFNGRRLARTMARVVPAHAAAKPSKQNQAKSYKSKQNRLDLLGFIRQNRDFSMGYGESK